MEIVETEINGLYILEPKIHVDYRGYFLETYNKNKFSEKIPNTQFIQDNESKSSYGVLRGLHFQKPPYSQAKLVRVIEGEVLDVVVDLRSNSLTFGMHFKITLSGSNKKQLFIPKGFAHGFVVKSQEAIFSYKVDNSYSQKHESGIIYNDPSLGINWEVEKNKLKISEKDLKLKTLENFKDSINNNLF